MLPLSSEDPEHIGPHRLTHRVGAGGMGQVYLAESPGGFRVVVKTILPQHAERWLHRGRFVREVEAARQVGGFHTAPVVGADPWAERPWVATSYVPGPNLAEAVREHGGWGGSGQGAPGLWELVAGLAEGLSAIHRQGLVHRDLKPANVILTADRPLVIDFGLARFPHGGTLTARGSIAGTIPYMSPEQTRAAPVGQASDLFSLGTVIVFAATGSNPFRGRNHEETMWRIRTLEPGLGTVPEGVRAVVRECWHKDPRRRPSAQWVLEQVLQHVGGQGPGAAWPPAHLPALPPVQPGAHEAQPGTQASPGNSPEDWTLASDIPADQHGTSAEQEGIPAEQGRGRAHRQPFGPLRLALNALAATIVVFLGLMATPPSPPQPTPETNPGPDTASGAQRTVDLLAAKPAPRVWETNAESMAFSGDTLLVMEVCGHMLAASPSEPGEWRSGPVLRDVNPDHYLAFFTGALSADGTLAAATWHNNLAVWDLESGTEEYLLEDADELLHRVALSPDGDLLVAAGNRGTAYMWETGSWSELDGPDEADRYHSAAFTPDGAWLVMTGAFDGEDDEAQAAVILWDTGGRETVHELHASAETIVSPHPAPGGQHVVTSGTAANRIWDLHESSVRELGPTSVAGRGAVAVSPAGSFAVVSAQENLVQIRSLPGGEPVTEPLVHEASVQAVAVSPDESAVATGDHDGTVRLWDTSDWTETAVLEGHTEQLHTLEFGTDGASLAGASGGKGTSGGKVTVWTAS